MCITSIQRSVCVCTSSLVRQRRRLCVGDLEERVKPLVVITVLRGRFLWCGQDVVASIFMGH
jgi:hypothetical protein